MVGPCFGEEDLGIVEEVVAHDGQSVGKGGRRALGEEGHGRGEAAAAPDFQTAQLVYDEEAGGAGGILRLRAFGTPPGMRLGIGGHRHAGAHGKFIKVGVHASDCLIVYVPGQLRLRRLALFVEGAVGSGQVTPTGERDTLAVGQKHVVDAQLLVTVLIRMLAF